MLEWMNGVLSSLHLLHKVDQDWMMLCSSPTSITLLHPGSVPITLCFARVAGIRELIEKFTGWEPSKHCISPGILAENLVAVLAYLEEQRKNDVCQK